MADSRYTVVFAASLTQFTIIGGMLSYGLFLPELEVEFGWSRTVLSATTSIAFLVMGLLAVTAGKLNDRFGPRRVLIVTGILYSIGYLLLARIVEPWQLIAVYGVFIGVGLSTHDVVTLGTIARCFKKRRGLMTGVVKVGTAIGQMAVPVFAAMLIAAYDWRTALEIMGYVAAVLLMAAALMMKIPNSVSNDTATGAPVPSAGYTFAEARKSRSFWNLCAAQFLFFPTLVAIPFILPVHGQDLGMDRTEAAVLISIMGGSSIVGRLAIGFFVDKIGGRNGYILCLVPVVISLVAFSVVESHWMLFATMALYGFGHGGLFTVVSPTIAEFFGMRAHGAIFGMVVLSGTIGSAVGPIASGWVFDVTGTFTPAFAALAVLSLIALILMLKTKPRSENQAPSY